MFCDLKDSHFLNDTEYNYQLKLYLYVIILILQSIKSRNKYYVGLYGIVWVLSDTNIPYTLTPPLWKKITL